MGIFYTAFPNLVYHLLLLSFSEFFKTKTYCQETNLTSHHEIVTGDNSAFIQGVLFGERKNGPEV